MTLGTRRMDAMANAALGGMTSSASWATRHDSTSADKFCPRPHKFSIVYGAI